jgi:hypothetical protein
MPNLRIGYLNRADAAVLTASPVLVAAAPVTYLQNNARGAIAQATSTASQDIKGTWNGTAYGDITQLTLWRHNLAAADTIRLLQYSDTAWTTQVADSTALAAYPSGLFSNWGWGFYNYYFAATAGVKSFKITVAASAAALQCARLYLGPYTEAPINPDYGFILAPQTSAIQSRSEDGSLRSLPKADWRSATFDMSLTTEADRAAWYEISRYCGITKAFVASLFPGAGGTAERDHTIYGQWDGQSPAAKLAGVSRYDFSLKLVEL